MLDSARNLLNALREKQLTLVTAESCTGGLIAGLLTEIPGSSDVVDRGFITYSNQAKQDMLGVPAPLLENYGAVSAEVAKAMAEGAIKRSKADIAVSVTGIAGPGGATQNKPVGLVFIAVSDDRKVVGHEYHFKGTRHEVRLAAVEKAVALLLKMI
jgi:nicotinamide-nucleotide amidase